MPSRKRSKGQARRAKTAAAELEEEGWLFGCRHGCPSATTLRDNFEQPEVCIRFYQAFLGYVNQINLSNDSVSAVIAVITRAKDEYPKALDGNNLQVLRDVFIGRGAESALCDDIADRDNARAHVFGLLLLEDYEQSNDMMMAAKNVIFAGEDCLKNKDILGGCERALTKFYCKRIPCSCLDKQYASMKSQPKMAVCDVCNKMKERRSMLICAKCERVQYCSRECQLKHWPVHKKWCKEVCQRLVEG